MMTEPLLLPAAKRTLTSRPPRWVKIAEDLFVGASADRVFLRWESDAPIHTATFGPQTWDRILKTIAAERQFQAHKTVADTPET